MIVYRRNGTFGVHHPEYICNNQNAFSPCRASFCYSYSKVAGNKVYYDDALIQRYLVTYTHTVFTIEYLFELSSLLDYYSAILEGLAKSYNQLHNEMLHTDLIQRRVVLYKKRMTE